MAEALTLEQVRAVVREELRAALRVRDRRLLSKRAAARLLGIDRGTTLERYIREGRVRLIEGRIPDIEIERMLAEGLPEERPRARRRPVPANDADEIRKVPI